MSSCDSCLTRGVPSVGSRIGGAAGGRGDQAVATQHPIHVDRDGHGANQFRAPAGAILLGSETRCSALTCALRGLRGRG
jgi:hypothetical protein